MGLMAEMKESVEREAKRYKCFYDYKNPNEVMSPECKYKPLCGCHAVQPPSPLSVQRHEREVSMRKKWCQQNNMEVNNSNLYKAPGDDNNFVYKRKPWRADGSFEPSAQYTVPRSQEEIAFEKQQKILWQESANWYCKKCNIKVDRPSRPFVGGPEPFWWWWCENCRTKHNSKMPLHMQIKNEPAQPVQNENKRNKISSFFKKLV